MVSKRKHSSCFLKYLIEELRMLDKEKSMSKLSTEFANGKATISDWKTNRTKIEDFHAGS